ncbi:hypothetical protein J3R30DRAFT_3504594 [Lentinula aciculospora]|uniref:Uncharacterized protein n=1 Tax=Lentinula aciculospora TaxID=153920 RepID=A0A9W9DL70_9AGAR|nr:hypothetical protein J3R30DRAFT_3504594 [Lentinula aciculospora]
MFLPVLFSPSRKLLPSIYMLLTASLLGVALVAASPLPDAVSQLRRRAKPTDMRIGLYQQGWHSVNNPTHEAYNALCIRGAENPCFVYTSDEITRVKPKTRKTPVAGKTTFARETYRKMKAYIYAGQALQSLGTDLESTLESTVALMQALRKTGNPIEITDSVSYIHAAMTLMSLKEIVRDFDYTKDLDDPANIQSRSVPALKFGYINKTTNTWARLSHITPSQREKPDCLCIGTDHCFCYNTWMKPRHKNGVVNRDHYRSSNLEVDIDKLRRWDSGDEQSKPLVEFLQTLESQGRLQTETSIVITDPDSYIRALLQFLQQEGITPDYDSNKPLRDFIGTSRWSGGSTQEQLGEGSAPPNVQNSSEASRRPDIDNLIN